jgi:DNA-binding transcriptional regulator YhcF (GntR family)
LEHEGILEVKHGTGAFIKESAAGLAQLIHKAQSVMQSTIGRLISLGLTEDELRRLFENELSQTQVQQRVRGPAERKP